MSSERYYRTLERRVRILESMIIEGKHDQEILNNFLGDDYYNKYNLIKNKISDLEYKDVYKLIKKDPDDVRNYIDNFQSKSDVRRSDKHGAKKLYEDSEWVVYKITTYDAAKHYGKGTKWCISGIYPGREHQGEYFFNDYIEEYNLDGYYFYINKNDSGKKYCLLQSRGGVVKSLWNANDVSIMPRRLNVDGLGTDLPDVFEINLMD